MQYVHISEDIIYEHELKMGFFFYQPKFSLLPVDTRTEYKTLMLAFKALKGMAPPYLQSLIKSYNPPRAL